MRNGLYDIGAGRNGAQFGRARRDTTGNDGPKGETTVKNAVPDLIVGAQALKARASRGSTATGHGEVGLGSVFAGAILGKAIVPAIRRRDCNGITGIESEVVVAINILVAGEVSEGEIVHIGQNPIAAFVDIVDDTVTVEIFIEIDHSVGYAGLPLFSGSV